MTRTENNGALLVVCAASMGKRAKAEAVEAMNAGKWVTGFYSGMPSRSKEAAFKRAFDSFIREEFPEAREAISTIDGYLFKLER